MAEHAPLDDLCFQMFCKLVLVCQEFQSSQQALGRWPGLMGCSCPFVHQLSFVTLDLLWMFMLTSEAKAIVSGIQGGLAAPLEALIDA